MLDTLKGEDVRSRAMEHEAWVARALAEIPSLQRRCGGPAEQLSPAEQRALLGDSLIAMCEPASQALLECCDEVLRREATPPASIFRLDSAALCNEGVWARHRGTRLCTWRGDITRLAVDAVVNAANDAGLGCFVPTHRCIDNVLHRAAGPRLREACRAAMIDPARGGAPLAAGTPPLLTPAFMLPARHILHVTGPAVRNGVPGARQQPTPVQDAQLAAAYRGCLDATRDARLRSIAFCCVSTGLFGFPQERAAAIALRTTREWLDAQEQDGTLDVVVFDTFTARDEALYARLLPQVFPAADGPVDVFALPEPQNITQLRALIAQLNALPEAPADDTAAAPEAAEGAVAATAFAYRYAFALAAGTPPDAFWAALKLKAAEAHRFVDVIDECVVTARPALGLLRDIMVRGCAASWMTSKWDGPPPGVEVRATERVMIDEEQRTVLYRERTGRFMCLNALVEQDGLVAMHGTYVYPAKRSRAAFLETNARLFAQLEKYATVVNSSSAVE